VHIQYIRHANAATGDEGQAYSTRDRCESVFIAGSCHAGENADRSDSHGPSRRATASIPRAKGTKSKFRNTMSALYNHAIRWEFTDKNSITSPARGSGVRQSGKRERIPDLLWVEELQRLHFAK
jgi:hypothetical protein